jgi:hypothetical protein
MREGKLMTTGSATNAVRALLVCAATMFVVGCPGRDKVSVEGEITTVVKGGGGETTPVAKGTWCCTGCSSAPQKPVSCTGCAKKKTGECPTPKPIELDCTGTTTELGGLVTCY